ncbi:hypothetical protein J3F83DRAFT_732574 [Trichoderma novae-zelandiae]
MTNIGRYLNGQQLPAPRTASARQLKGLRSHKVPASGREPLSTVPSQRRYKYPADTVYFCRSRLAPPWRLSTTWRQNFNNLAHYLIIKDRPTDLQPHPLSSSFSSSAMAPPSAELSHLPKADGSANFSFGGYTITAAVNGPVEAQRRDENPFEALVDVNVRPAAGVGGTAERQLEAILQPALRHLVAIRNFPRCVIQVTLQVMEAPENAYVNSKVLQPRLNLGIIPSLLHAAMLGLLTAAIPLKTVASATCLAITNADGSTAVKVDPSPTDIGQATSVHVLGFTANRDLLLAESEGSFTAEDWGRVLQTAESVCCRGQEAGNDAEMGGYGAESENVLQFMRSVLEAKAAEGLHWR